MVGGIRSLMPSVRGKKRSKTKKAVIWELELQIKHDMEKLIQDMHDIGVAAKFSISTLKNGDLPVAYIHAIEEHAQNILVRTGGILRGEATIRLLKE